jgi:hypothetical protein
MMASSIATTADTVLAVASVTLITSMKKKQVLNKFVDKPSEIMV